MPSIEQELEGFYPWIPWREPFKVGNIETGVSRVACRFCISAYGLSGENIEGLFKDEAEHAEHLVVFHNLPEGEPANDNRESI